jgi:hypothetical protein
MSDEPAPRGILPDAVTDDAVVLIKGCTTLRLTYEIRLATYMARQTRKRLLLVLMPECSLAPALRDFVDAHGIEIRRRAP